MSVTSDSTLEHWPRDSRYGWTAPARVAEPAAAQADGCDDEGENGNGNGSGDYHHFANYGARRHSYVRVQSPQRRMCSPPPPPPPQPQHVFNPSPVYWAYPRAGYPQPQYYSHPPAHYQYQQQQYQHPPQHYPHPQQHYSHQQYPAYWTSQPQHSHYPSPPVPMSQPVAHAEGADFHTYHPAASAPTPPAPPHYGNVWLGRSKAEVDEDNMRLARHEGAYEKRRMVPDASDDQMFWVVELDGSHSLRDYRYIKTLNGTWQKDPRFEESYYFLMEHGGKKTRKRG